MSKKASTFQKWQENGEMILTQKEQKDIITNILKLELYWKRE